MIGTSNNVYFVFESYPKLLAITQRSTNYDVAGSEMLCPLSEIIYAVSVPGKKKLNKGKR